MCSLINKGKYQIASVLWSWFYFRFSIILKGRGDLGWFLIEKERLAPETRYMVLWNLQTNAIPTYNIVLFHEKSIRHWQKWLIKAKQTKDIQIMKCQISYFAVASMRFCLACLLECSFPSQVRLGRFSNFKLLTIVSLFPDGYVFNGLEIMHYYYSWRRVANTNRRN